MRPRVNLFSDTQTTPTAAMRAAIAAAEVGDEQLMADPTVNELCARVAALLGFESAVFLPSGTMCNEIAIRVHIRPGGDAMYCHRLAHPLRYEGGGPAALSGAVVVPLDGERGMFSDDALRSVLTPPGDRYAPRPRLVTIEQTTNVAGGRVWSLPDVRTVLAVAHEAGLRAHLDGARLMNAVVASGVPATEWCAGFDTAWIDFTKGLGAPVGAVLAGSAALIEEVWRYKQMMGGAMRQAGIVAAGCLYALDHHVERLAEDHARAARLAAGLAEIDGIALDPTSVETNIVIFSVDDASAFLAGLASHGVAMSPLGPTTVRAVTHLDVDDAGIETAIAAARATLSASSGSD
jgi:threonine aldolase